MVCDPRRAGRTGVIYLTDEPNKGKPATDRPTPNLMNLEPVTPNMVKAGIEELEGMAFELLTDRAHVVEMVYWAMEYQRRADLGQPLGLRDHSG